jgi:DNA-binding NarL/FixJ family response regulator
MQRRRILIVTASPILRDILSRGLSREPRLDVACLPALEPPDTLASALLGHEADAIVVSPDRAGQSLDTLGLLCERPSTVVVTLEDDGRTAAVRRLRPEVSFLSNVSVDELAASILAACDQGFQCFRSRSLTESKPDPTVHFTR